MRGLFDPPHFPSSLKEFGPSPPPFGVSQVSNGGCTGIWRPAFWGRSLRGRLPLGTRHRLGLGHFFAASFVGKCCFGFGVRWAARFPGVRPEAADTLPACGAERGGSFGTLGLGFAGIVPPFVLGRGLGICSQGRGRRGPIQKDVTERVYSGASLGRITAGRPPGVARWGGKLGREAGPTCRFTEGPRFMGVDAAGGRPRRDAGLS